MKSNKILYIVIGVVVLSVMIAVGVLFMSMNKSGNKMTNGMNEVAKAYIQSVNTGEYDKAYEKLSYSARSPFSFCHVARSSLFGSLSLPNRIHTAGFCIFGRSLSHSR